MSPAVRVSAARDLVDFVDKFQPGAGAQVLGTFPAETRELFESTPRSSWFPIEHDHHVVDGVIAVLGRARAIECWRDSVPDIVDKPLLKSFVAGMIRLFGRDPSRIISLFPKAWPMIYRDFCTLRFEGRGPGSAALVFDDCAAELAAYPNYFASWHGICLGFAHLAQVRGSVEMTVARDHRSAVARFTWK